LLEWAQLTPKRYQAQLYIGCRTQSGDKDGEKVAFSSPLGVDGAALRQAFSWLSGGTVMQIPPAVSALKQKGRRLYQATRQGQAVWPIPRLTHIAAVEIIGGADNLWTIEAEVGSGTYIRALARDVGYLLGVAARLEDLQRTQVGSFSLGESVSWDDVQHQPLSWLGNKLLGAAGHVIFPIIAMTEDVLADIVHGRMRSWPELDAVPGPLAGIAVNRQLVAVLEGPPWRYRKVLGKEDGQYNESME
ncbi:MAG: tRNA pseudouridine(55) synthase TruB, partial [Firmicutes bacterium]|nr:tRNA pseudouridine(55) synthase TruB [Bacillota bacterium]